MTAEMSRAHRFSASFNFRDLGGLPTRDGRSVRWRRLFRADSLHGLTDDDRADFERLGIRTVLDLRRPTEVERHGRVPDFDGLTWHNVPPAHRRWEEIEFDESAGVARYLADRYLDLIEEGGDGIAAAISLLAEPANAPVVVHCFAGKDRTGVVCALTLAALGVDDADIVADYALSHEAQPLLTEWLRQRDPDHVVPPEYFIAAPADAMLHFLDDLRARDGGLEQTLARIGVGEREVTALRSHLLD